MQRLAQQRVLQKVRRAMLRSINPPLSCDVADAQGNKQTLLVSLYYILAALSLLDLSETTRSNCHCFELWYPLVDKWQGFELVILDDFFARLETIQCVWNIIRTNARTHAHTGTCTLTRTQPHPPAHTHTQIHTHTHIHANTHACTQIHKHTN